VQLLRRYQLDQQQQRQQHQSSAATGGSSASTNAERRPSHMMMDRGMEKDEESRHVGKEEPLLQVIDHEN
jgi:hypothetical protein